MTIDPNGIVNTHQVHWTENPDSYDYRLVGQDDYGNLWVARRNERQPEVAWTLKFRRRDPRCWLAWFRSWRAGACCWLEAI